VGPDAERTRGGKGGGGGGKMISGGKTVTLLRINHQFKPARTGTRKKGRTRGTVVIQRLYEMISFQVI